jgi:peptidoglycan-N-acetylglucosamine deacetylase
MGRHSPPRPLPVRRLDLTPVFVNPSGRRWRCLRVVLLLLVAGVGGSAAVVVPEVVAAPALAGAPVPDGPTVLDVGQPPVIGEGPLVRVVRLLAV